MLAEQRHAAILRGLEQAGEVTVAALARQLAVTDETIRRDLTKLADRGRLVRTHGGAVPADLGDEPSFAQRQTEQAAEKGAIARLAAARVEPGEVIAIDASSTGLELAKRLPDAPEERPITVVSNGLDVVRCLANRRGVRVVCTGGEYDAAGACFVGPLAEATLRQFAFRSGFLSCRGLDPDRGATEASPSHAALKRVIMALSDESVLLVDSSKIGLRSACHFAVVGDFASIITDDRGAGTTRQQIAELGALATAPVREQAAQAG